MKVIVNIFQNIWDKLFIGFGTLFVILPLHPMNLVLPYRDSGVFLYIGWRILRGEIPYLNVWDQKPPIIYYLNALGLSIGRGSRVGVWYIEVISLFLAALIGFTLLRKAFGILPAVFSLVLFFFSLGFLIQGGNLTTEYTLPLQLACLFLVYQDFDKNRSYFWHMYLIGLLIGLAFFTKQNTIGIGIAIAIFLLVHRLVKHQFGKLVKELIAMACGCLCIALPILAFFAFHQGIIQFWDQAFHYNLLYTSAPKFTDYLFAFYKGIKPLLSTGIAQIGVIGYIFCIIYLIYKKDLHPDLRSLLSVALIDMPIELVFVSRMGGWSRPHYYIALLPILSFFSAFTFFVIISQMNQLHIPNYAQSLASIGVLIVLIAPLMNDYINITENYKNSYDPPVLEYIKQSTSENDTVLLWGSEAVINYMTQRPGASPYVYQYPLYFPGYVSYEEINGFLNDIIQKKPRIIIDTKNPTTPFFKFIISNQQIRDQITSIQSQYHKVDPIGSWDIYTYVGPN